MNIKQKTSAFLLLILAFWAISTRAVIAQTPVLKIDTDVSISPVSPMLYGLMTEEINYSYDGGLYAEMIRNRTFQSRNKNFSSWLPASRGNGEVQIDVASDGPSNALQTSMRLKINLHTKSDLGGVANTGYWGMGVRPSTTYTGSFFAKSDSPETAHILLIADASGEVAAEATILLEGATWKQHHFKMSTNSGVLASSHYHLEVLFDQPGTVFLQLMSLMGPTYKNRTNGNRPDLMELMAAMNPKFLRLPGGNYLEGDYIKERFNWKETIGPLVDRPTHRSPWNYTSSDGLGLLEFLEWCEDLKIEPVLAIYAGYSLKGEHVTGKDLEPFIQDALDEIEYVTGGSNTKWGAMRANGGHPAPFPLHFIEIGNEDYFDKSGSYDERFQSFAKAIREKYPQFKLISTAENTKGNPDVQDDHYYRNPEEMFGLVHKYDHADRNGPKIFVGEWATRTGSPTPDFGAALGDAAFMIGMERNSDLIIMSAYAPLLVNVNPGGMQWPSDLIGYDAHRSYGSPSYYAQSLFANHVGDHSVRSSGDGFNSRFFWSATVETANKLLHLKIVNASSTDQAVLIDIPNASSRRVTQLKLHGATRWATNDIEHPNAVRPESSSFEWTPKLQHNVPANAIEILDIYLR